MRNSRFVVLLCSALLPGLLMAPVLALTPTQNRLLQKQSPTFYVNASTGNDANTGRSPQTAFKTLAHLSAQVLPANSVVLITGSFASGDALSFTAGTSALGPVSVGSYAGGAKINSGNSAACVVATNVPSLTIGNLTCVGGGNTTNTTAGIQVINSQSGNTTLPGPTIAGNNVSGYGLNGVQVLGSSGTSGFNGVTIYNNIVHDVTGNYLATNGSSCIQVSAPSGYGSGITSPTFLNVFVIGNLVYNCTGTVSASNWVGSGIFVGQTTNATISFNIAHDFGQNSTYNGSGAGGIWTADGTNHTISFNECYNGQAGSGGIDGGCFDLDGGVTNSVIEYNYAHDSTGWGYLFDNYPDAANLVHGNNTIRFNVGQNNGKLNGGSAGDGELGLIFQRATTGPEYVYNNTFYNQTSGTVISDGASTAARTVTIANNILLSSLNSHLLNITTPTGITMAGNDYYTYGQAISLTWSGTTYTSFASWQTATGQEKISGTNVGLTSNPNIYVPGGGFVSGGNGYAPANLMAYNLQSGSPMIGAGLNLLTQFSINAGPSDFYGVSISATSMPVGAANGDFSTFAASCSAASNFLARVSSFTKAQNVNYNSLLCGMNSDGDLAKLDALYVLGAPNSAASLLNLVSTSYSLTANGTTTFTANVGIAGDGSTGYFDTGFNPSTAVTPNYVLNSATIGAYVLTNRTTASVTTDIGAGNSLVQPLSAASTGYGELNENTTGLLPSVTTAKGLDAMLRGGVSTPYDYFVNASIIASATVTSTTVPTHDFCLLARIPTAGGAAIEFSTDQIAIAFIGAALSPYNFFRRLNSFEQALGNNVY